MFSPPFFFCQPSSCIHTPVHFHSNGAPLWYFSFPLAAGIVVEVPYIVTAIVRHVGTSFDHGHYTALARKTTAPDSPWALFDDHKVKEISHQEVVNNEVYMLLLRRQDSL